MRSIRILAVPLVAWTAERLLVALAWNQDVIQSLLTGHWTPLVVVVSLYAVRLTLVVALAWSLFRLAMPRDERKAARWQAP